MKDRRTADGVRHKLKSEKETNFAAAGSGTGGKRCNVFRHLAKVATQGARGDPGDVLEADGKSRSFARRPVEFNLPFLRLALLRGFHAKVKGL
jgi:hypothetical protein